MTATHVHLHQASFELRLYADNFSREVIGQVSMFIYINLLLLLLYIFIIIIIIIIFVGHVSFLSFF